MKSDIIFTVVLSILAACDVRATIPDSVRRSTKGKPKSKSKPNPKPKPSPGDENASPSGESKLCDGSFNRSDVSFSQLLACGDGYVCLPTAESVVAAVGSFDVVAAMKSSASLDIRCTSKPTGLEHVCSISLLSEGCAQGEICMASSQPVCLSGCTDRCYDESFQQGSGNVHDQNGGDESSVLEESFSAFFIVNAGIGVLAVIFLGRKVWQSNSAQFDNVPADSGHEMVYIEENESF